METIVFLKLMRLPEVTAATGLKRSWIYKLMADGDFPRQVRLSQKAVAWRADEIEQWILSRPRVENQTKEAV